MTLRSTLLFLLAVALTACGFQLRGSNLETLKHSQVYIQSDGANDLAAQIRQQLGFAEVPMINDPGKADYIVELGHESFNRSILSVSPKTGKVEEYKVSYNASLSIRGPGGKVLLQNEPVTAELDFTFNENSVLSKAEEEQRLHNEITRYAADIVLRRLQAVTH